MNTFCTACGEYHESLTLCPRIVSSSNVLPGLTDPAQSQYCRPAFSDDAAWDAHCERHLKRERELASKLEKETERADLNYKNWQDFTTHWEIAATERDAAKAEVERLKEEVRLLTASCHTIHDEKSEMFKAKESANLQVESLRRWISLYSECDCDVSKNKGMIHWFACRYVLGQKALGHAIETKGEGAENRVGETTCVDCKAVIPKAQKWDHLCAEKRDGPCPCPHHEKAPHLVTCLCCGYSVGQTR
jgi:hypothetical protein